MSDSVDICKVIWTLRARRRLNEVDGRTAIRRSGEEVWDRMDRRMDEVSATLAQSFPGAAYVVVQDVHTGYRPKPRHAIVLVEVAGQENPGQCFVKTGPVEELDEEWKAWRGCFPDGLPRDPVLMALSRRVDNMGRTRCLVYEDASQSIGMDRTDTLENAFLSCVRSNDPTIDSMANVLSEMLRKLGHLLYGCARSWSATEEFSSGPNSANGPADQPSHPEHARNDIRLNADHWLGDSLDRWDEWKNAVETRREALTTIVPADPETRFWDPVDYFRFILEETGEGHSRDDLIPRMLRGNAHGDLHGRNVIVGLEDEEAHWPSVFDYEDMACDNLLVWDFIKLEMELKIRAYQRLFRSASRSEYPRRVFDVETRLFQETEEQRRLDQSSTSAGDGPVDRLCSLLLTIRSFAADALGRKHTRPADWLHEYYFALACYGVYSVSYENQSDRERMAAFVSAGAAAARFHYSHGE